MVATVAGTGSAPPGGTAVPATGCVAAATPRGPPGIAGGEPQAPCQPMVAYDSLPGAAACGLAAGLDADRAPLSQQAAAVELQWFRPGDTRQWGVSRGWGRVATQAQSTAGAGLECEPQSW